MALLNHLMLNHLMFNANHMTLAHCFKFLRGYRNLLTINNRYVLKKKPILTVNIRYGRNAYFMSCGS